VRWHALGLLFVIKGRSKSMSPDRGAAPFLSRPPRVRPSTQKRRAWLTNHQVHARRAFCPAVC